MKAQQKIWGVRPAGSKNLPTLFLSEREARACAADRGPRWEVVVITVEVQ